MPQTSPTRDSHRDSPLTLDENKSRQSPGMTDNQSGQNKNMFSMPEAEEVSSLSKYFFHNLIKFLIFFSII